MFRQLDGKSLVFIAQIFIAQSVRIVFGMPGDKDLSAAVRRNGVNAGFLTFREYLELRAAAHIFLRDPGMAGMRDPKFIVKTAEQDRPLMHDLVAEDAEHFLIQQHFPYAVMMIQSRLRTPTDMQCAVDMGTAPIHDLAEFLPVFHLFELHLFDRRAGDDHPVVIFVFYFIKGLIETDHMLLSRMLRHPLDGQKLHIDLQRRIA